MVSLISHCSSMFTREGLLQGGSRLSRLPYVSRALFTQAHSSVPMIHRRCFSASSAESTIFLRDQLASEIDKYKGFIGLSNQEKINRVFDQRLKDSLGRFDETPLSTETTVEERWGRLSQHLGKYGVTFPSFDQSDTYANARNVFGIFPRNLLIDEGLRSSYNIRDYILTVTEFYWSLVPPAVAFTHNLDQQLLCEKHVTAIFDQAEVAPPTWKQGEKKEQQIFDQTVRSSKEDAFAAMLLATSYINEETLVHEMGCWNGEDLTRLLYYAHLQGKNPCRCIGTDINDVALNFAESTLNYLGISNPLVQFHLANAQRPLDFTSLDISYTKEVKIGLRVIPVLEPKHAKRVLRTVKGSFRSADSVLIVSYPILKGTMYERNQQRASVPNQQEYRREPFEGGVVFKTPFQSPEILPPHLKRHGSHDMVINAYYSEEGFKKLAQESGFIVKKSIHVGEYSDNYRIVSVLAQK